MTILLTQQGAGADITGTGALAAQASAVSGAGISASVAASALSAQAGTVVGAGISSSVATGSLVAQAAAVAGAGNVSSGAEIIGSGAPVSQSAQIAAAGISLSTGSGSLVDLSATVAGQGAGLSEATGSLTAQSAQVAGAGTDEWVLRGGYYVQEDGVSKFQLEDLSGFFLRENPDLVAQASQVSASGISESTGTGALVSDPASVSGTGTAPVPEVVPRTVSGGKPIHREGVTAHFLPGIDPASYVLLDDELKALRKPRVTKKALAEAAAWSLEKEQAENELMAVFAAVLDDEDAW